MIASCHATAGSFEKTNWAAILSLYDLLSAIKPGPVVEMNKAIAIGYPESPESGLRKLKSITGLENSYIYYAALGDFYADAGNKHEALKCYQTSASLTRSKPELNLLKEKIERVGEK